MADEPLVRITEEKLNEWSGELDDLTQERYDRGQETYGQAEFLKVDLFKYAHEEIADAMNYLRFLYIKLRILEEALYAGGFNLSAEFAEEVRDPDEVSPNAPAFSPSAEVQGFLSGKKQTR